jgi:hypothetical protein
MSNAAKVIAMDAFASYRTYTLLCKTCKVVYMHLNTYIPPRENAPIDYYYDSQEDFLSAVYAADVDILIYTSTISAGCSFELLRFKQIFAFFSDQSCNYKTAIQMLGWVRNIESCVLYLLQI